MLFRLASHVELIVPVFPHAIILNDCGKRKNGFKTGFVIKHRIPLVQACRINVGNCILLRVPVYRYLLYPRLAWRRLFSGIRMGTGCCRVNFLNVRILSYLPDNDLTQPI